MPQQRLPRSTLAFSIGGFLIRHQSLAHTPLYGFLMVMLVAIVTLLWLLFDNNNSLNFVLYKKEVENVYCLLIYCIL